MTNSLRTAFVLLVAVSLAAAALITVRQGTAYRVDLDTAREIWSDLVHDVDKVGLGLTRVSTREEIGIGERIHAGMPLANDDERLAYIEAVGRRLADQARRRDIPYRFHILKTREINAFAIPGGNVYITQAMLDLMETEAELASVLGHEIAHIDLRHCIEHMQYEIHLRRIVGPLAQVFGLAYWLLGVSYNHQEESEADRSGLLLMAQAGYDPAGAVGLDQRMRDRLSHRGGEPSKPQEPVTEVATALEQLLADYFKTHPEWPDRIQQFRTVIAQNESAWRDRTFCAGRRNFAERTPCFDKTFPGETRSFEQVLQEMNEEPAPAPVARPPAPSVPAPSEPEPPKPASPPAATLRIPKTSAQALGWGHDELEAGHKDAALHYFDRALNIAYYTVLAITMGDESQNALLRRNELRSALLETFDLSRDLGQSIAWRIDPALVRYGLYEPFDLCRLALLPYWQAWDDRAPFAPAVAEAERRGLTPVECWWKVYPPY